MTIKPTIKGYLYAATAGLSDATIEDENGLTLTIKAREQVMFTATSDHITVVSGVVTLTQVR